MYGNVNGKRYGEKLKGLVLSSRCWLQEKNGSLAEEHESFMREKRGYYKFTFRDVSSRGLRRLRHIYFI
jgi:hypothetical protein